MANPQWVKGISANSAGRPKKQNSTNNIKGKVSRFILRNASPQKLQGLFDKLTARDKLYFLTELLPYVMPKQSSMNIRSEINSLSPEALDELYSKVVGEINDAPFEEILSLPEPLKSKAS